MYLRCFKVYYYFFYNKRNALKTYNTKSFNRLYCLHCIKKKQIKINLKLFKNSRNFCEKILLLK